jgi:hypothetical protein
MVGVTGVSQCWTTCAGQGSSHLLIDDGPVTAQRLPAQQQQQLPLVHLPRPFECPLYANRRHDRSTVKAR